MIRHALKENDSLEKLSAHYGIPACMILRVNGFPIPSSGQGATLIIPDRQYCIRKYEAGKESPQPFMEYTICEGDTIYEIAQRHRTTMNIIARLNSLHDPENLMSGQSLKILKTPPGSVYYSVKPSDTLNGLSSRFSIPEKCLRAYNYIPQNSGIYPGMQLIIPQPAGAALAPK